jgi:G3E family GTPase
MAGHYLELYRGFPTAKLSPITVLTGFLGAGKTTLLNRILTGGHGLRVAVPVNDFDAINIDAELVIGDVISLANGCVCCTIRDDLIATVVQPINRPEAPEYILLEASGVADPWGIAITFVDPELRDRIRLHGITCVVDSDQVFAYPEYPAAEQLKLRQIAFADMMILNKVDLAGPEQVQKVRSWIDGRFSRLRIVETSYCNVPPEILLSVGRFDLARTNVTTTAATIRRPSARGVTRPTGRCHWKYFERRLASCRETSIEPKELSTLRMSPSVAWSCKPSANELRYRLRTIGADSSRALVWLQSASTV